LVGGTVFRGGEEEEEEEEEEEVLIDIYRHCIMI
jgi:hypothetical protein